MLSKKQAKLFFLGGTVLFALIFLGLSVDSLLNGIPKNTNEHLMSQDVKDGKRIWEEENCMGCHTLMGEGAYYAPELTKVYSRRGEGIIKAALMTKTPWGSNGRKMVAYGMSDEDASKLVAFFEWTDKMYLNGFPAEIDPKFKK